MPLDPKKPRPNPGAMFDTRAENRRKLNVPSSSISQSSVSDPEEAEGAAAQTIARWGSKLNPDKVKSILKAHSTDWGDFVKENGDKALYSTKKLFDWLGY